MHRMGSCLVIFSPFGNIIVLCVFMLSIYSPTIFLYHSVVSGTFHVLAIVIYHFCLDRFATDYVYLIQYIILFVNDLF